MTIPAKIPRGKRSSIPQLVLDACRRGDPIVPLRRKLAPGVPPYPENLSLLPMTLNQFLRWQQKYNPPNWMVFTACGLEYYFEDRQMWKEFCRTMHRREDCSHFLTEVQPPGSPPIRFKAFGPTTAPTPDLC